ncbi:MAG: hypothetical protein COB17_09875 [Sulfurimonas sp.]|nr:MAG: hypothetical protein COB17_09875 [Sulfurimonas sp.]
MQKESISNVLSKIYLFSSMNDDELNKLSKICSIHEYKKDSYLFMKGDTSESLFVLIEGIVSVFKHDDKGNEIIIAFFNPFSLIAEPAILQNIPFPSNGVFKTDAKIIKIKLDSFKDNFLSNSNISYGLIQSLLHKIQLLQQNIHLNIATSAKEKILHFYKQNQSLNLDLKKYEIAALLGMTAETLSRNLKNLEKEQKISKVGKNYELL